MKRNILIATVIFVFFLPVIILGQNVIQVTAGDNQIDDALFGAQSGDTLELVTDGGIYHEQFSIVVDKPLTIRAAAGLTTKPVITCDQTDHIIEFWDDLTLEGIALNGALGDSLTAKCIRTGDSTNVKWGYNLTIDNCDFLNFKNAAEDDGHAIYANTNTQADKVVITNSLFAHGLQEIIYFKNGKYAPGSVRDFRIENCTLWDTGDEAIYVEDHDNDVATPGPAFYANHLTIYDATAVDKNIYPKGIDGAIVKNCLIGHSEPSDATPVRIYGTNSVAEYLLFWNTKDYVSRKNGATVDYSKLLASQNPYLKDPDNGDFAVAANSPAALFADDSTALGDLNNGTWDASDITCWELVANKDWERLIENALTDGDTVMFVTDGGEYYNPKDVSLPKFPLTLMAKPGLESKPMFTSDFGKSRIMKAYAQVVVKGMKFVGDGVVDGGTPYGLRWNAGGEEFGTCIVEDCEFLGFRLRALHMDKTNHTDTLIVNNCLFKNIGETGIYGKDAARNVDVAKITNSTFYRVGQKGIYLRNVGDLEVSHCTFCINDTTISGRSGNVGVYARNDSVVAIHDNIFMRQADFGCRVYGDSPIVEYNLFWECDTLIKSEDNPTLTFPIFNLEDDPMFKSIEDSTLDLAVEVNSSAVGMASDGTNLGDPRWGTWESTGVARNEITPQSFYLSQNYPNPFNPETSITYSIAEQANVKLYIYNILGQKITTLVNTLQPANRYTVIWNGKAENGVEVTSGVYFYRLEAGDFVSVKKMLYLR